MPVRLRLTRMGRKKIPFYRIVAIDSRKKRDGAYLDKIGHYNPLPGVPEVVIDKERAMKWLDRGAIPSDTVKGLLQRKGILLEWDLKKHGMEPDKIDVELKKWEALQIEREKRREAMAAMTKREKDKEQAEEKQQAAPVEAAAEPAAVEQIPVEAAPVEAAPVETAPVEAAPVEAVPVKATPVKAKAKTKAASAKAAPAEEKAAAEPEPAPPAE